MSSAVIQSPVLEDQPMEVPTNHPLQDAMVLRLWDLLEACTAWLRCGEHGKPDDDPELEIWCDCDFCSDAQCLQRLLMMFSGSIVSVIYGSTGLKDQWQATSPARANQCPDSPSFPAGRPKTDFPNGRLDQEPHCTRAQERIILSLLDAIDHCQDWSKHHPSGCKCEWCDDVRGITFTLQAYRDILRSQANFTPALMAREEVDRCRPLIVKA
jgi:hypothetical protein